MKQKSSNGRHTACLAALFFLAVFLPLAGACFAAESESAANVRQMEVTVIHVDQYAVYAPNLIFYFDAHMEKGKIASLTKMAEKLRNKKAVITYSSTGDLAQDKHALLLGIAPAVEKSKDIEAKKVPQEVPKTAGTIQEKPTKHVFSEEVVSREDEPVEPEAPSKQTAFQEKKTIPMAGRPPAITKEEVTAFVRQLLDLNGKKDLSAVMPFYADRVDYYDRGVVNRDYVRRDLGYYFRNWENITTSLDGDVVMIVLDDPAVRIVKFISYFSVSNDKKSSAGRTENIWKIQRINGELKLIDVKQKVIAREG